MNLRVRPRRLRANEAIRSMVRENHLNRTDLIYPLFVCAGSGIKEQVESMPNVYRYSIDQLDPILDEVVDLGILAIILFGIPASKDAVGSGAYDENGIVQQAMRYIKKKYPQLIVIGDVCLCEYTDHGHCGLVDHDVIVNDATVELLAKTAVSQAKAGADIVAPSDMMDGRVGAIREALDEAGFTNVSIMSYAAKYASSYYGPFRDAAGSAPKHGDRKTYQMDPANGNEAIREVRTDIEEGADMIIVKPALAFGDIMWRTRQETLLPIVAYNVSGEYAMVKAAAQQGWIDERKIVLESLTGMKRAGADMIITYHALDAARWLAEEN